MSSGQQKLYARVALLGLRRILRQRGWRASTTRTKISTNVLDLIPTAEQSPEVDLVRGFASDVQSRVMLFALRRSRYARCGSTIRCRAVRRLARRNRLSSPRRL